MSHATHPRAAATPIRLAALAALALLALSTAILAGPRQAGAAADEIEIRSGHADWGVRESFRNYIVSPVAHGDIATFDGASTNADGTFRFPVTGGGYDPAAGEAEVEMAGRVRFRGHESASDEYELWIAIANPRAVIEGPTGTLYADVVSRDRESGEFQEYPGVALAELESGEPTALGPSGASWDDVSAVLSEEGAPAFGGFYPAGQKLDPIDLVAGTVGPGSDGGSDSDDEGDGASRNVDPAARRPQFKRLGGRTRLVNRNGVAALAMVGCRPPGPCVLRTRRFAAVRVGRRAFRARVLAPKAVEAGGWASVRLWLAPRPRRVLSLRRGRVSVPVVARSGGQRIVRRVGAVLRSVPFRGGRGRAAR